MTKLIRVSERDVASLEKIRHLTPPRSADHEAGFEQLVVVKPWGHEFLVFENAHVAIWFLHVRQGHSTSMHCHPRKKTSLIVLDGQALCNTFYNRNYLTALDAVVIEQGVFHSTKSLSPEGIYLLEVETPPDKADLVRLDDQYGREGQGYEGLADMKHDHLEAFDYFFFEEGGRHVCRGVEITLGPIEGFRKIKGEFYCPCDGPVHDEEDAVVLDIGDSAEGCYLSAFNGLRAPAQALFLRVRAADTP